MDQPDHQTLLLPLALVAEIESVAATEERAAGEMLRDAVALYVRERRSADDGRPAPRTPAEAAARILERRRSHPLPAGESIRDLMTYGRA